MTDCKRCKILHDAILHSIMLGTLAIIAMVLLALAVNDKMNLNAENAALRGDVDTLVSQLKMQEDKVAQLEENLDFALEERSVSRSGNVRLSENDMKLLAMIVHAEAEGEPFLGKAMVARVVLNRADRWNMSVHDVIYQRGQFDAIERDCFKHEVFTSEDVKAVYKGMLLTDDFMYFCNLDTSTDSAFINSMQWVETIGKHSFAR